MFAYYQRYLQIIIISIVQKDLRHKVDRHLNFRYHISVQFYFRNQLRRQSKSMHLYFNLKLLFWLREFWNNCLWSLSQSQSSSNWQRFATFYQLQINRRSSWPDFFGHFDVLHQYMWIKYITRFLFENVLFIYLQFLVITFFTFIHTLNKHLYYKLIKKA